MLARLQERRPEAFRLARFFHLVNYSPAIANLSMRVLARFLAAATDAAHFPAPSLPEIAFLGRSNVGKSSVINSLVGAKMARTSSTPGRTRSINFFEIRWPGKPQPELIFADLPGYGLPRFRAKYRRSGRSSSSLISPTAPLWPCAWRWSTPASPHSRATGNS